MLDPNNLYGRPAGPPSAEDKKKFVERAQALSDEGVDLPDAVLKLHREFWYCFTRDQAAHSAKHAYEWAAKARIANDAATIKNAAAIKLYDSLIALGWTPPA